MEVNSKALRKNHFAQGGKKWFAQINKNSVS